MMKFNLFQALFSGSRSYREEFSSQVLAFLLAPNMPHGFRDACLRAFLQTVKLEHLLPGRYPADGLYCRDVLGGLDDEETTFAIEIEAAPARRSRGRIDILLRLGRTLLAIENKIISQSVGDAGEQIRGYCSELSPYQDRYEIIPVVIYPNRSLCTGHDCNWQQLSEALRKVCAGECLPASGFLLDFCDYTDRYYPAYPNADGAIARELLDFEEFLSEASGGEPSRAETIRAILSFWHEKIDSEFIPDDKVYDGPIMFLSGRDGKRVYPFKISRAGSLILQRNALRQKYDRAYWEIHRRLLEAKIFAPGKSSCPIAAITPEVRERLFAVFTAIPAIMQKEAAPC